MLLIEVPCSLSTTFAFSKLEANKTPTYTVNIHRWPILEGKIAV